MNAIAQPLPDECILIARALKDPTALAAVYDHYAPRVYTYMRYRVNDRATADDLTAQTFEHMLDNLPNYRADKAPFAAWLFGIAHHMVSRHYRAKHRWQWLPLDAAANHPANSLPPESAAIHNETQQQLVIAVSRLTDDQRNLIALKFAGGLNNRQIASITGLSESNVGVILYRSINCLREILNDEEIKHES
ncbi:MAG: sigma-70 family RNA polymerase sigma factor [Chloroflexi bacterium]|nr:sigma-70 family RNA polymerase sigma factor [Chloroflexota bacterium]MCC6894611.1 sigma-70 family RNA polymerase sigma factor [Anaerolineae bacterium]